MIGSLFFLFETGKHNNSILLQFLFFIWVLRPFIGLLVSEQLVFTWPRAGRKIIYIEMIVISITSAIAYTSVFNSETTTPAFIFLIKPVLSWLSLLVTVWFLKRSPGKKKSFNEPDTGLSLKEMELLAVLAEGIPFAGIPKQKPRDEKNTFTNCICR
ncbi:MAG: hypothetical protein QM764_20995 [Chitinophagaceae bacterium]